MLSVLQTRDVSWTQERSLGSLKWVSHQQTYIALFTSFTQGCHCGKVLDDSLCVDSLASTGFSAGGGGKKRKALLKQLQLILVIPVQPAPPLKAVLTHWLWYLQPVAQPFLWKSHQIDWMKRGTPMTAVTRSSHSWAQKFRTNPCYTKLLSGAWSFIANIQTDYLGCTYVQLMN